MIGRYQLVHIVAVKKALTQLGVPIPEAEALHKVVEKKVRENNGTLTFDAFSAIIGFFKQLAAAPQTAVAVSFSSTDTVSRLSQPPRPRYRLRQYHGNGPDRSQRRPVYHNPDNVRPQVLC